MYWEIKILYPEQILNELCKVISNICIDKTVDDMRKYEKSDVDSIFAGVGSCAQISLRLAKFGAHKSDRHSAHHRPVFRRLRDH